MTALYSEINPASEGYGPDGLAILSREPALESHTLELPNSRVGDRRALLSARLHHGSTNVWLHCSHLNYRLSDGRARENQVVAIDEAINAHSFGHPGVHILGGDFNATPECDEIRFLRGLTTLAETRTHYQDAWLRHHQRESQAGNTWSAEHRETRKTRSVDVDRRLDYLFVSSRQQDGSGTILASEVVLRARVSGHAASDHFAVLADVAIRPF